MKRVILFLSVCLLGIGGIAQKKKTGKSTGQLSPNSTEIKIPMTADRWDFEEGKVEFIDYKGVKAARLDEKSGFMILKDLNFKNGTIEFDVEVNQPGPFAAIYFHWQDKNETEHVYLRTSTYSEVNSLAAVQYASIIKGVNIWDLQFEYQSAATIRIREWNHVKLVVSGKQLRVYVNYSAEPNLEIPCLEGNTLEGKIGLGTGFPGQTTFANLLVKPGMTEGLPETAAPDITKHDTRYIRNWQVSDPDSLPYGRELFSGMLPKPADVFTPVSAGRRGLVNLTRKFGSSNQRRYVWLKVIIKSEMARSQVLKMGFSDEIWVYLNRAPIYVDKNIYYQNLRKSPDGRISLDNCSFPISLKQGENELLVGIANDFYGWGIMARLESLDGIEVLK